MPEESQALVRFVAGWAQDGISDDGLPRYRETVRVIKSVPPYTEVEYEATPQDFEENPGPHALFMKQQGARLQEPKADGFPLALWPVISPAQFKTLADRNITTIEQLSAMATRTDVPGEFKELAQRAKQMLALSSNIGKFEAMVLERDRQIEALTEQVIEMRATISAQTALINTLKMTAAPVAQVA